MQYHYLMRSEAKPSSLVSIRAWAPISGGSLWEEQSVHLHHFLCGFARWKKWQLQTSPEAAACSPPVHCLQTLLPHCSTYSWGISGGDPSLCCPRSAGTETLSSSARIHEDKVWFWTIHAVSTTPGPILGVLGLMPCSLPFCSTFWFKFSKHPSTRTCLVQFPQALF